MGSQSLPCTLILVPPSHGQLGALVTGPPLGKEASCFVAIPCRPVLFSFSAPLGNREGGSGEGGPCRTGRSQPKEAALRAGGAGDTLHHDPQARGVSVLASQAPAPPWSP